MRRVLVVFLCVCFLGSAALGAEPLRASSYTLESRSYLYGGNTAIYLNNVVRTRGSLNVVCPDYFEVDANGNLKITHPIDKVLVTAMHDAGIKVIPFLSNHWNQQYGRKALANRVALTTQIVKQINDYNLDGVDVDLENLTKDDRDNLTAFVRLLRDNLPPGKTVSICVAANPNGQYSGWQDSFDYAALGALVDTLFIMTYDESYVSSPAGPVSSLSFVEQSVTYALKHVPAAKIMLGIPFYGRYWGNGVKGKALTIADIDGLAAFFNANSWYDKSAQCARAVLTIPAQTSPLWGGKKLDPGVYDIWYENHESYARKLDIVSKYGIKGAGSWALGQEPESIWTYYRGWLYGLPYPDIYSHWSQSHIIALSELGIITGRTNGLFDPNGSLTRAEAAIMLCRMLELPALAGSTGFADADSHWARGFLNAAVQRGILRGYDDGTLRPDKSVTREELCVLFDRVLHVPDGLDFNEKHFSDVSPQLTPWSNNAIVTQTVHGVLNGYDDGTFRPHKSITRGEASKVYHLCLGIDKVIPPIIAGRRISMQDPVLEPR